MMTRNNTTTALLVAADIGNVNLKYRTASGPFALEPSLVRRAPLYQGFSFTEEQPLRSITYHEGPAELDPTAYLVGNDAEQSGSGDVALIGSASMRVTSDPYLLLHLYAILSSLPRDQTFAQVIFAGGLPVEDATRSQVSETLKQRLRGTHVLTWGETTYTITIVGTMFVPQPIGAIATLLFDQEGRVQSNGSLLRKQFALDVGGGTTDFTGREGLKLIPDTEGGVRLGVHNAAHLARQLIQRRYPALAHLDATHVLTQMRRSNPLVHISGEPVRIQAEIQAAIKQTSDEILAHILPQWERHLAQGEVLLFGGGGECMAGSFSQALGKMTRVTLLSHPLFRVLDGIERMAKRQVHKIG